MQNAMSREGQAEMANKKATAEGAWVESESLWRVHGRTSLRPFSKFASSRR